MQHARIAIFLIAIGLTGAAGAQAPASSPPALPTAGAPATAGGIQSQNIFEVKPDASDVPGYANQSNGERAKVQPGNNAPMWRQVGQGVAAPEDGGAHHAKVAPV